MVDYDVAHAFAPFLRPGERVLWTGRPAGGLLLTGYDVFLVPFSLLWAGIAFRDVGNTLLVRPNPGSVIFGVIFGSATIFILFGRFVIDAWVRSRTLYALTGSRALALRYVLGQRLLSTPIGGSVSLRQGLGGRGSLFFQKRSAENVIMSLFWRRGSWQMWLPSLGDSVSFLRIEDAAAAYQLAVATPTP